MGERPIARRVGFGLHASRDIATSVKSYAVEGRKEGKKVSVKFSAGGALLDAAADED
jgi:hypothetical protein